MATSTSFDASLLSFQHVGSFEASSGFPRTGTHGNTCSSKTFEAGEIPPQELSEVALPQKNTS